MKILHFVSSFNNGGIETMLVNLVNLQVKEHQVGILVLTDNVLENLVNRLDSHVKLIQIRKPVGSKNIYFLIKLYWKYVSFKPDIFHFHDHNAPKLFPWKMNKEKRFATIHNIIPTKWNKNVDKYVAISRCVKDGFLKQTGKCNCVVLYNGINLSSFICKKEYRQKPLQFLTIGRLYPSKGMDIVIQAIALLKNKFLVRNILLDVWGDGQEYSLLQEIIIKNNLNDMVTLKGNMNSSYVEKHICDYDCVIQGSRHEGFGLTAIEAMVSGVPTILSNIDGYKEVSENGKYSLLFSPEDPLALAESILEMMNNYTAAIERAQRAKEYVTNNFSIDTLKKQLDELYVSS